MENICKFKLEQLGLENFIKNYFQLNFSVMMNMERKIVKISAIFVLIYAVVLVRKVKELKLIQFPHININ